MADGVPMPGGNPGSNLMAMLAATLAGQQSSGSSTAGALMEAPAPAERLPSGVLDRAGDSQGTLPAGEVASPEHMMWWLVLKKRLTMFSLHSQDPSFSI